ncbi:MAG TPA: hypothetical protein VMO24_06975 [Woeseiaceae bacterium]|nr:hypothetical protein [Woeseiaceae bacterium]
MSNKQVKDEVSFEALKSESARQRWQLFHRAIAHAKQANSEAMEQASRTQQNENGGSSEEGNTASPRPDPRLSIAR